MIRDIQVGDEVKVTHLQGTENGIVESLSGSKFDFPKVTVQFNQGGMISLCTFNLSQISLRKCDICNEGDELLTETDKALFRPDYTGIDFYNEICVSCWNREKDVR